jgi:hypothetical protein
MKYSETFEFAFNQDIEIKGEIIPKGRAAEIMEVNKASKTPYKVWIEGYRLRFANLTETEIDAYAASKFATD